MPNLVPIRDAAVEYGINRATLHRAVRDGRLTVYDGGLGDRKVYLDRDELESLLKPVMRSREATSRITPPQRRAIGGMIDPGRRSEPNQGAPK